jgi:hypothetical protein
MTAEVATDTKQVSKNTSLIKEYTMRIVEQLAKQDEILEQIAWIRAVVSQRFAGDQERNLTMDKYLDSVTDYTGSVCGDSVSDDVAEEMHRLSLESPSSSSDSSTTFVNSFELSPFSSDDPLDSMTIVIGNTHRMVTPQRELGLSNKHLWSFFVQASGEEVIQEVAIYLVGISWIHPNLQFEYIVLIAVFTLKHPTFLPPGLILTKPPYRVTRIGWGYFSIRVTILLKPGYIWHAEKSRSLELTWKLDFEGFGSSASDSYDIVIE